MPITPLEGLSSADVMEGIYEALDLSEAPSWANAIGQYKTGRRKEDVFRASKAKTRLQEKKAGADQSSESPAYEYRIKNRPFEAELEVDYDDYRLDDTGQTQQDIESLQESAASHWEELLSEVVNAAVGTTHVGDDGTAFFGALHPIGKGSTKGINHVTKTEIPSLGVVNPDKPTVAEMMAIIADVIPWQYQYKDHTGRSVNGAATDFSLMYSPGLMGGPNGALVLDFPANGTSNPVKGFKGRFDPLMNPYLTDKRYLYLIRTNGPRRAIILNELFAPEVMADAEGGHEETVNNRHLYKIRTRRGVGFNRWQSITRMLLSTP